MVTSPGWEWVRSSRATRDGECQEEDENLGSTVHGGGHKVVPLDEVLGAVLSQVVLAEDTNGVVGQDRGVNSYE